MMGPTPSPLGGFGQTRSDKLRLGQTDSQECLSKTGVVSGAGLSLDCGIRNAEFSRRSPQVRALRRLARPCETLEDKSTRD